MNDFFRSMDEKLLSLFKGLGRSRVVAAPKSAEAPTSPLFLMMGSLTNCSIKDAEAYARGLAATYITAPELGRFRVFEDRGQGRIIYEIQEGGCGFSVAEKVLQHLASGRGVRLPMTNGAHVIIEQSQGEVYTLVYPAAEAPPADVEADAASDAEDVVVPSRVLGLDEEDAADDFTFEDVVGVEPLKELYPENLFLVKVSGVMLGMTGLLFLVTGVLYVLANSGLVAGDVLYRLAKQGSYITAEDSPVAQLGNSYRAAGENKSLKALKRDSKGKWSWELE